MSHATEFDTDRLLAMSRPELDRLFRASQPGGIPRGKGRGTVLLGRSPKVNAVAAALVRRLAWQGKVFDPVRGELRNLVTPFGIRAIRARVYRNASWSDGGECIVLDYSHTSLVAHWIRDEIRRVGNGAYLGNVYWGRRRILEFSLTFREARS
ncbi:hypothetical protein LKL35_02660 [Streptomyces sp. ET3-23]|uniref:hypothetical protein n=1 Tax=Streptomyces sp. ET3-23 TaxID=2885643 RepID=UPI001D126655|nr:hypothetical protein [Streptomyces sp. ET3-23]MCC2274344.1 hypothetical protein [Streptomyces sp. ET3-23]